MDDKFLYTFLYMAINLISFLACASRLFLPGRPLLNQVSSKQHVVEFWKIINHTMNSTVCSRYISLITQPLQ